MTETLRVDKWLWFARFFKSRAAATRACNDGLVRLGGRPLSKAHQLVRPGDVLTFSQGAHIRVVKVLALGARRGPASEAAGLYEDLKPPSRDNRLPAASPGPGSRQPGAGRPTKRERRRLDRLRGEGDL